MIVNTGRNTVLAKFDTESAFRNITVHPNDWLLLRYEWQGKYYHDVVVPLDLRSAPAIFDSVATLLEWAFMQCSGNNNILHYFVDFLFFGRPDTNECARTIKQTISMCRDLVAPDKFERPDAKLVFLGIAIDTSNFTLSVPEEKYAVLIPLNDEWAAKRNCTKRELLSLIGVLGFVTTCVRPAVAFCAE